MYIDDNGNIASNVVYIEGATIINPTKGQYERAGYHEYISPTPEPILPTIEELVERKLRERYTINQEFEVQRKRDTEPDAFQAYYDYVEECITWANKQQHRDGPQ